MMGGWAIFLAFLCFLGPMAIPFFAVRWRSFLIQIVVAAAFFGWLTLEVGREGTIPAAIGSFLGGLMLTGFGFGAVARFAMLIGRPTRSQSDSTTD
jgi:hypothetical protein